MSAHVVDRRRARAGSSGVPAAAARPAGQVARRVPRARSLPVPAGTERQRPGPNDLGRVTIADDVVATLAAGAAVEVDGVGAPSAGVLGRLSGRPTGLGALPSADAKVDGHLAVVTLTLSVRYPGSVRQTAGAVRDRVRDRVAELTGLDVAEVDITVSALLSDLPAVRRVR